MAKHHDSYEYITPITTGQRKSWLESHTRSVSRLWPGRHSQGGSYWLRYEIAHAKFYRDYKFWWEFRRLRRFLGLP